MRACNSRGFSLIELVVAITIFSVIGTTLFAAFSLGVRAWQRINESEGAIARFDRVFSRLDAELKGAVMFSQVRFEGDKESLSFFTTKKVKGELRLLKESYFLDGKTLKYRELDLVNGESREIELMGPLSECSFEYAKRDPSGRYEWVSSYKPNAGLPGAVRVKLVIEGGGPTASAREIFYVPGGGREK